MGKWDDGQGNANFIWSKSLGVRPLDIFGTSVQEFCSFNDLGQLIGLYYDYTSRKAKPFLWDNGILSDMSENSDFATQFQALGYHVMNIKLTSMNNKGEIAGYFQ